MLHVTKKSDYAMRAMTFLASRNEGKLEVIDAIANAEGIPRDFMAKILKELTHARLVRAHRGPKGGYEIARNPAEISILDIVEAVDGPLELLECCGIQPDQCGRTSSCLLRSVWLDAQSALKKVLGGRSLADLNLSHYESVAFHV